VPDVSPDTSPKYPPKHAPVHDTTPTAAVLPYRPALQFVHVPAAARLYCPAGHVTCVELMDPAGHAYPAVQFPEHAAVASADTFPKVPGGHKVWWRWALALALALAPALPWRLVPQPGHCCLPNPF
jgi:hypothetical protein